MSKDQRGPDSINPPDASRADISDDLVLLIWRSLPRLKTQAYRDNLSRWIRYEAGRCSCVSWSCESLPPSTILHLPDLLKKLWGFERLLAYDIYRDLDEPSDISLYESFLATFYASNNHCLGKADDLIHEYLEKEKVLTSEWKATEIKYIPYDKYLSATIQDYLSGLLNDAEKERHPFLTYCVAYLTKEAELLTEWLRRGNEPSDEQYDIMVEIRNMILVVAMLKGDITSVHTAAVLLGIKKEVEFLLKCACDGNLEPIEISTSILVYALDYLTHKFCGLKSDAERVTSTAEVNQLTGVNTESVSLEKNKQEQSVPPEIPGNILLRPQDKAT